MNRIEQAYDGNPQYEWDRLARHRVEYGLTMRALSEHLPPAPAKIADIGGSVGRYAIEFARRGYEVTLVDIAEKCLDFANRQAAEAGVKLAGVVKADARDLSAFADAGFDAVLLMGPLYHLLEHAQRLQAIREARRLLHPGGLVFAAFITPNSIVQFALARDIDYLSRSRNALESILSTGVYRQPDGDTGLADAWLARPEQVGPLMAEGGFEQLDLLNCDALAYEIESHVYAAGDDLHREWLDLLYRLSRDASILSCGGHLLYVGQKSQ